MITVAVVAALPQRLRDRRALTWLDANDDAFAAGSGLQATLEMSVDSVRARRVRRLDRQRDEQRTRRTCGAKALDGGQSHEVPSGGCTKNHHVAVSQQRCRTAPVAGKFRIVSDIGRRPTNPTSPVIIRDGHRRPPFSAQAVGGE
jgi:hypothetical protein